VKVEGETFYLLETGDEKHIFNTEDEAITKLKEISENEKPNPEETLIFEVNSKGEEWSIKQVPWSKIAIGLLGE